MDDKTLNQLKTLLSDFVPDLIDECRRLHDSGMIDKDQLNEKGDFNYGNKILHTLF